MSNEFNNEMENYEIENCEGTVENETEGSGNGRLVAGLVAGTLVVGGLVATGIKKLKNKKADKTDKPKKQKTKLKLVRVPVEDELDEVFEEEYVEAEEETK